MAREIPSLSVAPLLSWIVPLLLVIVLGAVLGVPMLRLQGSLSVTHDGVFYAFPDVPVTVGQLRALASAPPSSQLDAAVRSLIPEPVRGRGTTPTPHDAVVVVRLGPARGLVGRYRGFGWPSPWVEVSRLWNASDVATDADLTPVWAMDLPVIGNGGRFSRALADPGMPPGTGSGPGGMIADAKGVIFAVQGAPGRSRSLNIDLPAIATSVFIVLAALAVGRILRVLLRRPRERRGLSDAATLRRLPLLMAGVSAALVLGLSFLPLREHLVRSATGHWPRSDPGTFATSLSFDSIRSLASQPGGCASIANAFLEAIASGTPETAPIGAGYAQPNGAVLDVNMDIWGRPGWFTIMDMSRRIPADPDDPSNSAGAAGPSFPPGPPQLRSGKPGSAVYLSSGGADHQRAIRIDVQKLLLKVLMLWALWLLARAPFVGLSAWRRRRRCRLGQCIWCGYRRAGIPGDAVCPECGGPASTSRP